MNKAQAGFQKKSTAHFPEYRTRGQHYIHLKSGMEVYHLDSDDDENFFALTFKTPPLDNSGLPHILEHSVLCGSEKYPLKDPFALLLKGSMHTFLNAMTFPDKTVYAASSIVEEDYFNLLSVYCDAVFKPRLTEEIFMQEGHRLESQDKQNWQRSGIVFNEMKGSYSSQRGIESEWAIRSLFKDGPYSHDSGGDPLFIPELNYDKLLAFWRRFYHPSNCLVIFYGNINIDKQLSFLEEAYLDKIDPGPGKAEIKASKCWDKPRFFRKPFPLSEEGSEKEKCSLNFNWLCADIKDSREVLALEVLSEILIGHSGSPLEKALIESGLGEDLSSVSGLLTEIRQSVFTVGLRGIEEEKRPLFEKLVMETLRKLVQEGIPAEVVEGALQRVEFEHREVVGGIPFGLVLARKMLRGWLHGLDPEQTLAFEAPFSEIKKLASQGPFFEKLIEKWLLNNPHRSDLLLYPDPDLLKNMAEQERENVEKEIAGLNQQGKEALLQKQQDFLAFQQKEETAEEINCIPMLKRESLPAQVQKLALQEREIQSVPVLYQELFSNKIVYLNIAFDLQEIDAEDFLYLPLLSQSLMSCGTENYRYDALARELSLACGGLEAYVECGTVLSSRKSRPLFILRLKCLASRWQRSLELLREVLLYADFSNLSRVKDLLLEDRNHLRSAILSHGNAFAQLRAESAFSRAQASEELWKGISQLDFLQERLDGSPQEQQQKIEKTAEVLQRLSRKLISGCKMTISICGQNLEEGIYQELEGWIKQLPLNQGLALQQDILYYQGKKKIELLAAPLQISFSSLVLEASYFDDADYSAQRLLSHYLRTGYLWEEIRMKGGAYGAFASLNGLEGVFGFSSYRDPQIAPTLKAFTESLRYCAQNPMSEQQLQRALIGTFSSSEKPLSPSAKSMAALRRKLYTVSDEIRQQNRDNLLALKPADISRAAQDLLEKSDQANIAVVATQAALDDFSKTLENDSYDKQKIRL